MPWFHIGTREQVFVRCGEAFERRFRGLPGSGLLAGRGLAREDGHLCPGGGRSELRQGAVPEVERVDLHRRPDVADRVEEVRGDRERFRGGAPGRGGDVQ